MEVNTGNLVADDPRTWSHTTRRIVGDAVRVGANKIHRSAQRSLLAKGLASKGESNEIVLLPQVSAAYKEWLGKPYVEKRNLLAA